MEMKRDKYITLNFKKYIVNYIDFRHNPDYSGGKAKMDINFGHSIATKNNEAQVTLRCVLFRNAKKEEKPFHLEVQMTGLFSFQGELAGEELKNLLRNQGLTVLFPYMRALITNITSNSGHPPIILPIINVNQLIEKQGARDGSEH
ncbi:MAG: protein-export chaperone SecB [Bacillota bacterium]